jgi:hypothetical protein
MDLVLAPVFTEVGPWLRIEHIHYSASHLIRARV